MNTLKIIGRQKSSPEQLILRSLHQIHRSFVNKILSSCENIEKKT